MALTELGEDKPAELVVTSLVRSQFAEPAGMEARMGSRRPDRLLIGMLSTLDTQLGRPMDEALDQMPLPQEVRDTLLGRTTSMSPVWRLVLAHESAQWEQLKEFGAATDVPVGRLPVLYRNAVQWVDRIHRMEQSPN